MQTSRLIPASREDVFRYITDIQNVPEMLGGKIQVEFPVTLPEIKPLAEFELVMTRYTVSARVIARVDKLEEPTAFSYRQLSGFFKTWSHVMLLDEHGEGQTRLTDIVDFSMPLGLFGALADDLYVRGDIERLLNYRAAKIAHHFESLAVRTAEEPGADSNP